MTHRRRNLRDPYRDGILGDVLTTTRGEAHALLLKKKGLACNYAFESKSCLVIENRMGAFKHGCQFHNHLK